jgi:hypothetical protein
MTVLKDGLCCEWFANATASVCDKGFGVIAGMDGRRVFYVEARPWDLEIIKRYCVRDERGRYGWPEIQDESGLVLPYTTSLVFPIQFCPQCGANLGAWIAEHPDEFDELASRQRELNPELRHYDS